MNNNQLSKKWVYIFMIIAILSFAVFVAAIIMKDVTIATATGMVAAIQVLNIVKWYRRKRI